MRGIGSYFPAGPMDGVPFGAYYPVEVAAESPNPPVGTRSIQPISSLAGLGTSVSDAITPSYSMWTVAIAVVAGYLVGKQLGYPKAGALFTGLFGMPGMLGVAIYSAHKKKTAVANRRRRHHRRRR